MCLTGVDYFSTLGYQPGIAFIAAGILSPVATLILVLLTLFGALPVYGQVAKASPHGQGSLAMLEQLLPGWQSKTMVLVLLGFAATDFIITITLSAADAASHIRLNHILSSILPFGQMPLTIILILLLGAIFLIGFKEAVGVSFVLVTIYLVLNTIVCAQSVLTIWQNPHYLEHWTLALNQKFPSVVDMVACSCLLFPRLALGLSGFETGVAVMPLVQGDPADTEETPTGRIKNTTLLLTVAALIMSVLLILSSFTTTLLIPAEAFAENGEASGRALSYLCHKLLGDGLGTVYDLSSIAILWFAGASAMAGLLNLIPRYLPRYGMAPDWAAATRPLVLFLSAVSLVVTLIFKADVDAQGGAYATGVLVLITSAALAVTLRVRQSKQISWLYYLLITLIFLYTTITNIFERPDGLKIASCFIAVILFTSLVSRALRSCELRVKEVHFDDLANKIINEAIVPIRFVAHRPGVHLYDEKESEMAAIHNLKPEEMIYLEVTMGDASQFRLQSLTVKGEMRGRFKVLTCTSPAVPNAIAAILLHAQEKTGVVPNVYLGWTEGNPVTHMFKFLFLGEGETASVVREILREGEADPTKRPRVHVA